MKKLVKILALLLALLMIVSGCGAKEEEEDIATIALAGTWNTLQPGHYAETGYYGPLVWQHIYDALVIATDNGYEARGAKEWSVSDDGLVITLKLDETAKFSDGEAVTAADWVFSAKLISDIDFGAPDYTKLNVLIAGTDENGLLPDGINTADDAFGVKAVDDYTLEITFKAPTTIDTFLSSYAFLYYVLPAHCFEGMTAAQIKDADFWTNPVCSGPWTVESHIVNNNLTLVPNEYYHLGVAKLDKLVVTQMDSSNFASALMSGSVDYVYPAVDPKSGATLTTVDSVTVEVSEYPYSTMFLMINNTKVNQQVRLAIDMVVDKAKLVDQLYGNGAVVTESIQLYGSELYNNDLASRYNPEEAKNVLANSGWDMEETFVILAPSGKRADIAAIVQETLTKELGMKVEVKTVGVGTMYAEAIAGNAHMIMGQGAATLDPLYFAYNHSFANAKATCIHVTDDKVDQAAAAISAATTDAEKAAAIMNYQQVMYDEVIIVPLCEVYQYTAYAARLGGIDPSLTSHVGDNTWEWYIVK